MTEAEILKTVGGAAIALLIAILGWGIRRWVTGIDAHVASGSQVSERIKGLETHIPLLVADVTEIKADVRQIRAANERFHEFAFGRLGAPPSVGPYSVPKEEQQ